MSITYHPLLRKQEKEISVSFSELLFDLIYVFSVTQLSHYLIHHLNWLGFVQMLILWFAVWMAWQHTVWVTNWFNPDKKAIRILLFTIMILGLIMASSIPNAFTSYGEIFALAYLTIQIGRTLFILFTLGKQHYLYHNFSRILAWFILSGMFWVSGIFFEGYGRIILWSVAVLCDYISPMFGFYFPFLGKSDSKTEWKINGTHLAERCQLFVIIAFGETILMTGDSLAEIEVWTTPVIIAAIISFLGSLAMWWIYFDVSSEAGSRKIKAVSDPGRLGLKYNAVHVALVGAIIVCAVGDEIVVDEPFMEISITSVYVLLVAPAVYLLTNLIYKWIINKTIAFSHVIGIAIMIILAPFSFHMNILLLNSIVLGIFVFVIILDFISPSTKNIPEI